MEDFIMAITEDFMSEVEDSKMTPSELKKALNLFVSTIHYKYQHLEDDQEMPFDFADTGEDTIISDELDEDIDLDWLTK